jgi:hypothetical protein
LLFAASLTNVLLASIRWQLLREPSGKFCQNSLAILAINASALTKFFPIIASEQDLLGSIVDTVKAARMAQR